jgi:hypothetical protein
MCNTDERVVQSNKVVEFDVPVYHGFVNNVMSYLHSHFIYSVLCRNARNNYVHIPIDNVFYFFVDKIEFVLTKYKPFVNSAIERVNILHISYL